MRELEAIRYRCKVNHRYYLEPFTCCGALLLLAGLLNLEIIKTVRIVDCVRFTKIRANMVRVAFEDELLAVLVGDQGNHLIAQLGQESVERVCQGELDNYCRRRRVTYRINVVRFLETTPGALSSQVVSSGQKMM